MSTPFTIASNQGQIAGGEVMLLAIAGAACELGREVTVVGPAHPPPLVEEAERRGIRTVRIPCVSTRQYLLNLRRWDAKERRGLLWCNGLRPAFATSGHRDRVVHLHQEPVGILAQVARLARMGARSTVVPSQSMQKRVPGSQVMWNWTDDAPPRRRVRAPGDPRVVGYLGRLSTDKGVEVLCQAMESVAKDKDVQLLLAGESRFVRAGDAARVDAAVGRLGDRVTRFGWMERQEFFDSVDLAVFPSVWAEPFGLVVAEAMAARCPFVISDAGALPEVAGAGHPWSAPAGSSAGLADAVHEALNSSHAVGVQEAHQRWFDNFSTGAGIARLGRLLADLDTDGLGDR